MRKQLRSEAGRYREGLWLQVRVEATDDGAGREISWVDSFEFTAEIRTIFSTDRWQFLKTDNYLSLELTTRWDDAFTPGCRIRFGETIYTIEGVLNMDQRDRKAIMACSLTANKEAR